MITAVSIIVVVLLVIAWDLIRLVDAVRSIDSKLDTILRELQAEHRSD